MLADFFSLRGLISQSKFAVRAGAVYVFWLIGFFGSFLIGGKFQAPVPTLLTAAVVSVVCIWSFTAISAMRMRDMGQPGWYAVGFSLCSFAFPGFVFPFYLYLCFARGAGAEETA